MSFTCFGSKLNHFRGNYKLLVIWLVLKFVFYMSFALNSSNVINTVVSYVFYNPVRLKYPFFALCIRLLFLSRSHSFNTRTLKHNFKHLNYFIIFSHNPHTYFASIKFGEKWHNLDWSHSKTSTKINNLFAFIKYTTNIQNSLFHLIRKVKLY